MKKILLSLIFIQTIYFGHGQNLKGRIVNDSVNSPSLKNIGGENPTRRVSVYLPPDYDQTTNRYAVIYFLHGFWGDETSISSVGAEVDKAISSGKIKPVILVVPNEDTMYKGSFYINSTLTGNWADFTAKDLVEYVDKNFRTIPNRESRGISGHSMGGFGAINMGMLFPEIFSCVYALSPAMLMMVKDIGPQSMAYKQVGSINTSEALVKEFFPNVLIAFGRTVSPNPSKPPFYCDLPFTYVGDSLVINRHVLGLWNKRLPFNMVDDHVDNLRKLKSIKIDWGRNEGGHIPLACQMFSQKLENLGIKHYAEEYIGTHTNKIFGDDGRVLNDMLPFFNTYLTFQELHYKTLDTKKRK